MRRWSYVLWFLSFVLPLLSQVAFAEVQRFRLDANESQITAKVNDPFGNAVNGALRVRQGEAQGSFRFSLEEFNISAPRLFFLESGNQVDVDFRIVGERQP